MTIVGWYMHFFFIYLYNNNYFTITSLSVSPDNVSANGHLIMHEGLPELGELCRDKQDPVVQYDFNIQHFACHIVTSKISYT